MLVVCDLFRGNGGKQKVLLLSDPGSENQGYCTDDQHFRFGVFFCVGPNGKKSYRSTFKRLKRRSGIREPRLRMINISDLVYFSVLAQTAKRVTVRRLNG